ncbi:fatty-acyl-CoA synthase [Halovenus aranensis]|uniref:Fatty-acyl-CoA synthase n=1 Tax=Halovenus aranensis TaxID=890420 RepID=A0A1G8X3T6_9EURY|nr:AMP-binding protein [Halovenus aranensis]SDJ85007.1 fatty-acyl-CoA synthase [Halovenus aranensis]
MTVHQHSPRPYQWVGSLSEKRAALTPDQTALVDADTGASFTYADLDAQANRTARLLDEFGVEAGDRVAVVSRNRPALVDCYFATAKRGAALAPLSHRLSPRELALMLDDIDPTVLLVEAPFADDLLDALTHEEFTRDLPSLVGLTDPDHEFGSAPDGAQWHNYEDTLPTDDSPVETVEVGLSDPHLFLHTGGSTGLPKQVVQTHGSIAWNAFNTIMSWGLRPDDVTPMLFPFFHTGGWNVLTIPLFHLGGTVIISRDVEPGQVLSLVDDHEATVLVSVPAVLRFMVDDEDWEATDLSSLRLVKSGGGPCRDAIIEAWNERGLSLSQGYGLTECGPNNFAMPEDAPAEKTASIGKPCTYVDARVVDDDGDPLPAGEVGELELASPHAADRYWNNEKATRETFGPPDERAWVSTGDLARVDDDGYYYIEGRKKNMFVSGGENVYPPEVEDVIAGHPSVEEVVVVPVADDRWGEVGKAVVEGDDSLTLEELDGYLDGKLARFKRPRHLAFVDSMPTSGPSKIDRQAIESEFGDSQ